LGKSFGARSYLGGCQVHPGGLPGLQALKSCLAPAVMSGPVHSVPSVSEEVLRRSYQHRRMKIDGSRFESYRFGKGFPRFTVIV
jgi:hypothetical protein